MALATSVFSGTAHTDGSEAGASWIQPEDTDTLLDNFQEELESHVEAIRRETVPQIDIPYQEGRL